jgi:hypothetical protein
LNTLIKNHHLVEFVRQTFGEPFGTVLLAGYGEEAAFREYILNLIVSQEEGREVECQLVISGNLPNGQDPLVLAALLKLLLSSAPLVPTLEFNLEEVLVELDWPDTPARRSMISSAITKYLGLTYEKKTGPPSGMLRGMYVLIIGYEQAEEKYSGGGDTRSYNSVTFYPQFIERLNGSKITFAGIEFGRLNSTGLGAHLACP